MEHRWSMRESLRTTRVSVVHESGIGPLTDFIPARLSPGCGISQQQRASANEQPAIGALPLSDERLSLREAARRMVGN
jgi:hypothetical protein